MPEAFTLSQVHKVKGNDYVRALAFNNSPETPFCAAVLTNDTVQLIDLCSFEVVTTFETAGNVLAARFNSVDSNQLWTCSNEGILRCWDLRTRSDNPSVELKDDSNGRLKPLLSFDINKTGNVICGGTELIRQDSFILFWDLRASLLLGGYWENHTDDVTCVTFDSVEADLLASGSMDGLVNVFDLTESSEDDAIRTTMNTGSTVEKIVWTRNDNSCERKRISCLTYTHDLQLWDTEEYCQLGHFSRDYVKEELRKSIDYWVDVLPTLQNEDITYGAVPIAVCGTQQGVVYGLTITEKDQVKMNWMLKGGHHEMVRCILRTAEPNCLLTGGEDGNLCLWTPSSN